MKQSIILIAAILTFTSCEKDEEDLQPLPQAQEQVTTQQNTCSAIDDSLVTTPIVEAENVSIRGTFTENSGTKTFQMKCETGEFTYNIDKAFESGAMTIEIVSGGTVEYSKSHTPSQVDEIVNLTPGDKTLNIYFECFKVEDVKLEVDAD